MPSQKKATAYHHGNLKADAVDVALAIADDKGASAITMRAIGTSLGVSHKACYRHFENQADLHLHVVAKIYERLALSFAADHVAGPKDMVRVYVDFAYECPHLYDLAFSQHVGDIESHPAAHEAMHKLIKAVTVAYMRTSSMSEDASSDQIRDAVVLLWSVIHGTIDLAKRGILRAKDQSSLRDYLIETVDRLN